MHREVTLQVVTEVVWGKPRPASDMSLHITQRIPRTLRHVVY